MMKTKNTLRFLRSLAIFLTVSLSILVPGLAHAAGNAVVSVAIPAGAIDPGEQFTININAQPNNAIAGMQFNLSYNPGIVTAVSVVEGNLLSHDGAGTYFNAGQIDNVAGTITGVFGAIISPGETIPTAGTFAVITMTAGSTGGSCPLTLSNVIVGDIGGNSIPVTAVNNSITIVGSTPETPPGGGGIVGGGGASGGATTSLRNSMTTDGVMIEDLYATDINMRVELRLYKDTIVKNKYGQALSSIRIAPIEEGQAANSGSIMIDQSYEIEPNGATFDESATLVFKYSPLDIPPDIPASNFYIALWDPVAMTWTDLGGTIDGEAHTVSVEINHLSVYALMAHNRPASLTVMGLDLTPDEIAPGGTVTASIVVSNQGDLTGTYEINLTLDDAVVSTRSLTVSGRTSETAIFSLTSDAVGEHTVSLGGIEASFIVNSPPLPTTFIASELSINPGSVNSGENVNISVVISNAGGLAGTYQAILFVDDINVGTKDVVLDGGESATVSFSLTPYSVGQHKVSIGGLQGFFEAKSPPAPLPAPELSSFSITPIYNNNTNTLADVKVAYQMSQTGEDLPGLDLVMKVFHNGELIEQISLLSLGQDGNTSELSYIPAAGWAVGEYSFQAELHDGENIIQEMSSNDLIVTPEALASVFNWWTLGAVIGIALILTVVLIAVIIYRRRDMLKY